MMRGNRAVFSFCLLFSAVAVSGETVDASLREAAIQRIESINRAVIDNQQKIQKAISDLKAGKITQREYNQSRPDRSWPDFSASLGDARLICNRDPADEYGYLAIEYLLSYGADGWDSEAGRWDLEGAAFKERRRLGDLLIEHHIERPDLWRVARCIGLPEMAGVPFFERLFHASGHKSIRASAALVIAGRYAEHTTVAGLDDRERRESARKAREWSELVLARYARDNPRIRARAETVLAQLTQVIGEPMVNLQVENLQGEADQVANYRGKVVLIDLWATWCSPCKTAIPGLRQMNAELKGKPFQLISMSVDEDPQDVIDYIEDEQPMPWVNWHVGRGSDQVSRLGIVGYPTYFLLDTNGVLRARGNHFGNRMRSELMRLLEGAQ